MFSDLLPMNQLPKSGQKHQEQQSKTALFRQIFGNLVMSIKQDFLDLNGLEIWLKFQKELDFDFKDIPEFYFFGEIIYNLFVNVDLNLKSQVYLALTGLFPNSKNYMIFETGSKYHQYQFDPDSFNFSFYPIFKLLSNCLKGKYQNFDKGMEMVPRIINVINRTRKFYDWAQTADILDAFLPFLNNLDLDMFVLNTGMLCLFLPTTTKGYKTNEGTIKAKGAQVPKGPFYWVPKLFDIWNMTRNCEQIDIYYTGLFARLAFDNLHNPRNIGFTSTQIQIIFTIGLKHFDLPVGKEIVLPKLHSGALCFLASETCIQHFSLGPEGLDNDMQLSFAVFIAFTLHQDTVTLDCLCDCISSLELFAHPSNSGAWSGNIFQFLYYLTLQIFIRSRNIENDPNTKIEQKDQLSQDTIDKVSMLLLPILTLGVFGKDEAAVDKAQLSIKYLSFLSPNTTFPAIIPKLFPALESLIESHRTQSAITQMCLLAPSLLLQGHYTQGLHLFIPFLQLSLPGLDINDPTKTIFTLMYYSLSLCFVPICDFSGSIESMPSGTNLSDLDKFRQSWIKSTFAFESWLEGFIEQIFILLDNLSDTYTEPADHEQEMLVRWLVFASEIVFSQLSDQLTNFAVSIMKPLLEAVKPGAAETVGSIIGFLSPRAPMVRIDAFLVPCMRVVRNEILYNQAGASIRTSAHNLPQGYSKMLDAKLHLNQEIMLGAVRFCGKILLEPKYHTEIQSTLDLICDKCCSAKGYELFGRIFEGYVEGLTTFYPTNFSSLSLEQWDSVNIDCWGYETTQDNLVVEWHTPDEQEIKVGTGLVFKYLNLALSKLKLLIQSTPQSAVHDKEFGKWICVLRHCLLGSRSFLKPRGAAEVPKIRPYRLGIKHPVLECGWLYDETHSEYSKWTELLNHSHEFLSRLACFLVESRPDDIDNISSLSHLIDDVLSSTFKYPQELNTVKTWLKHVGIPGDVGTLPRYLYVRQVNAIRLARMDFIKRLEPVSPALVNLALTLVDFSLFKYRTVRIKAQARLLAVCYRIPQLQQPILSKVVTVFLDAPSPLNDDSVIKGCLYTVKSLSFLAFGLINPEYRLSLLKAFLKRVADASSMDDALFALMQNTFNHMLGDFSFVRFDVGLLKGMVDHYEDQSKESYSSAVKEYAFKFKATCKDCHQQQVEILMAQAQTDCHWRVVAMILILLQELVVVDFSIGDEIIEFALVSLKHESLWVRQEGKNLLLLIIRTLKRRASSEDLSLGLKKMVTLGDTDYELVKQRWSEDEADNIFVDKMVGWICFPNEIKLYKGYLIPNSGFIYPDQISEDAISSLQAHVLSSMFWNNLGEKSCLEPDDSESLEIDLDTANLVYKLTSCFREKVLVFIFPVVNSLVLKEDAHFQKGAVELTIGVLLGTKYMPPDRISEDVIPQITKILELAIENAGLDGIALWSSFWNVVGYYKDSKRYWQLFKTVMNWAFQENGDSYLRKSKQLLMLGNILTYTRLNAHYVNQCMEGLLKLAGSKYGYGEIRENVGFCLNLCSLHFNRLSYSSSAAFLEGTGIMFSKHPLLMDIKKKIEDIEATESNMARVNFSKTLVSWLQHGLTSWTSAAILPYIDCILAVCDYFSQLLDLELQSGVDSILRLFPRFLLPPHLISDSVAQLSNSLKSLEEKTWQSKIRVLYILEMFFLQHAFLLTAKQKTIILRLSIDLLVDETLEVRNYASVSLTSMFRLCRMETLKDFQVFLPFLLTPAFQGEFERKLNGNHLPEKVLKKTTNYQVVVRHRHGAVLGLCSIVLAYPFSVPNFIVPILLELADCAVSNPNPISSAARALFLEFKRSHQDTWQIDKLAFTDDELYTLNGLLVSPSYYA